MVFIRSLCLMQRIFKGSLNISKDQKLCCGSTFLRSLQLRNVHVLRPVIGFELSTNDRVSLEKKHEQQDDSKEKKGLKLVVNGSTPRPPLVILLPWLMSKPKHIKKFSSYYLGHGFDVLSVRTTPRQILWPTKGSQLVASDLATFLDLNPEYDQLVVHGFSVGGYVWGEVMIRLMELGSSRSDSSLSAYDGIARRVRGCIWDSACDFTELPRGVAKAIFPSQAMLRNALESYARYHMKMFYETATQHYIRSSQIFHSAPMRCPSLLLFSKSDPIGTARANLGLYKEWTGFGMKVYTKCWEKSAHVAHYLNHPHEYIAEVTKFLEKIALVGSIQQRDDERIKISSM